jgi:hypothetical protein
MAPKRKISNEEVSFQVSPTTQKQGLLLAKNDNKLPHPNANQFNQKGS